MAPEVLERLARIQKAHDALPRPPQVGRTIGLASPPTTRLEPVGLMVISSWSRQLSVSEHMGRPAASPRAAATTSRGVATPITRLRRWRARPHAEELEEVVGQTDQRPLGGDFVIAAEGKAPKGA